MAGELQKNASGLAEGLRPQSAQVRFIPQEFRRTAVKLENNATSESHSSHFATSFSVR